MIEQLKISNYQSIKNLELELAPFTVIVGPSSSGKSALTRALKTLTSNQRGESFISYGERQCTVSAKLDNHTVTLDRGKKNSYTVISPDHAPQEYTKLSGTIPEEVSHILNIPPQSAIHFASQFDMPYLLTSTPQESARILGELTNVDIIFNASREANRQRLAHNATLKTRAGDKEQLENTAQSFGNIEEQLSAINRAEEAYNRVTSLNSQHARLSQLITTVKNIPTFPSPRTIPDISHLEPMAETLTHLRRTLETVKKTHTALKTYTVKHKEAVEQVASLTAAYDEALRSNGTCPTCNQSTKNLNHSH